MQKLKLALKVIENVVLMRVVEQPDDIVRGSGYVVLAITWGGWSICSLGYPSLERDAINIRGTHVASDTLLGCRAFGSNAAAHENAEIIEATVRAYNESREQKTETPPERGDGWRVAG